MEITFGVNEPLMICVCENFAVFNRNVIILISSCSLRVKEGQEAEQ